MAAYIDKVIVTNRHALRAKYGRKGLAAIQRAVAALIRADLQRGLVTRMVALDDAAGMSRLNARRVNDATDPEQNKNAIDDVYRALAPAYLIILGSTDVVPHQDIANPAYSKQRGGDPDRLAFGDLPYACEAAYSRQPQAFLGPTRVVGRLPDLTGARAPRYLIGVLRTAAHYRAIDHEHFIDHFAVTAQRWRPATRSSLAAAFGDARGLQSVPPRGPHWKRRDLARPAHFINCHGDLNSQNFRGQYARGHRKHPVALDAAYIDGKLREGTVAAAECCYGGQLYDPADCIDGPGQMGICNAYLGNQCYGFLGSTTIAYGSDGPAADNGQADYMCQFFMRRVAQGASLGRALLMARQEFVRASSPLNPVDFKTLAQFNLYGDPSLTPVRVPDLPARVRRAGGLSRLAMERSDRQDRRRTLFRTGVHLADTEPITRRTRGRRPSRSVLAALHAAAREHEIAVEDILSYAIQHPRSRSMPRAMAAAERTPNAYHLVFHAQAAAAAEPRGARITALIGTEVGGRIVSIRRISSR